MELYQIKRRIELAVNTLRINDNYLLKHDVSERSIAHRLAIYLESTFGKEYHVDCEYNKNIEHNSGCRKIEILKSRWNELNNFYNYEMDEEMLIEKIVVPDIIIHRRGTNKSNIVVIEIKKSSSRVNIEYDYEKLKAYTCKGGLTYKYGVFINFKVNKEKYIEPDIRFFMKGEKLRE